MQRLEVSGAVRLIYRSLGVKGFSRGDIRVRYPGTEAVSLTKEVVQYAKRFNNYIAEIWANDNRTVKNCPFIITQYAKCRLHLSSCPS